MSVLAPSQQASYRSEIDGLRAIAVLGVLLFHINAKWLPGGFVGVDIFFVISGYVVCRSIMNYPSSSVWTSLKTFYQRRIRRLLPALLLMLVVTALLHSLFVPAFPAEQQQYVVRFAIFSIFGLSNLYAVRAQHQYFDGNTVANPFLHTWSLAVEEQFYLVLPLMFFLARSAQPGARLRLFTWMLVAFLLGSLLFSAWASVNAPVSGYYTMPSRFWELAVGCSIALWERHSGLIIGRLAVVFQTLGLLLLGLALFLTPTTGFPFPGAIAAVLGTVLVICAGEESTVFRLLRNRIASYIGKISYSLYLWHFPVIFFVSLCLGMDGFGAIATIALSLLCAMGSFHLVEQRFTHQKANVATEAPAFRRMFAITTVSASAAALTILSLGQYSDWFYLGPAQDWRGDWQAPHTATKFAGEITSQRCHLNTTYFEPIDQSKKCFARAPNGELGTMVVVGDSHAYASWPMISAGVAQNQYHMLAYSMDGCSIASSNTPCQRYWQAVLEYVSQNMSHRDTLYVALFLRNQSFGAQTKTALERLLIAAQKKQVRVILEAPLPVHQEQAVSCLPAWFKHVSPRCKTSRALEEQANLPMRSLFEHLAAQYANVRIWDATPWLCPHSECQHFEDAKPLYRDDDHLSYYGSKRLAPEFARYLANSNVQTPESGLTRR